MDQKHLLGNSDARSISRHHIEKSEAVPASTIPLQHFSSRMGDRDGRLLWMLAPEIARETVPQKQGRRRKSACTDSHRCVAHMHSSNTHACTHTK